MAGIFKGPWPEKQVEKRSPAWFEVIDSSHWKIDISELYRKARDFLQFAEGAAQALTRLYSQGTFRYHWVWSLNFFRLLETDSHLVVKKTDLNRVTLSKSTMLTDRTFIEFQHMIKFVKINLEGHFTYTWYRRSCQGGPLLFSIFCFIFHFFLPPCLMASPPSFPTNARINVNGM